MTDEGAENKGTPPVPGAEEFPAPQEVPLLPVRDMVVFPFMIAPLLVGRERSVAALDEALKKDRVIFLAAQRKGEAEDPTAEEIYPIGTLAAIVRMLKMPDGKAKILVQGLGRGRILAFLKERPYHSVQVEPLVEEIPDPMPEELVALIRSLRDLLARAVDLGKTLPPDIMAVVENISDPGRLADLVASHLSLDLAEAQKVLEIERPSERLTYIHEILSREIRILGVQRKIQDQTKEELSKTQREYFLRQQLKTIQQELGEKDERQEEVEDFRSRIHKAGMSEEVLKEVEKQLSRLSKMHPDSAEAAIIRTYLEWMVEVPWKKGTRDRLDLVEAKRVLDEDHYDLEKVKERILEYLGVLKLRKEMKGPILCFVGPPGVGKTSLGRSIARAMGRKFIRMSLGGVRDEAEIRGHRRTYIGALPGRIIQGMKQAGSRNPVFMLDEIDKLGMDFRGDPSSALLEVLDPEQNNAFRDHYLGVPYDLSSAMFITTANMTDPVPTPLLDRMEVIRLPGYTAEEKKHIARRYLVPRQMERNGIGEGHLLLSDSGLDRLIAEYTREAGVRNLEREIGNVCRKMARAVAEGHRGRVRVTAANLSRFLGSPRYLGEEAREAQVGVANGLAWTPVGGELLTIEVSVVRGKGALILTGSLGEVMKESAQAALSFIRSRGSRLGLHPEQVVRSDVHVHVPAGATPKDGPSAGIAITTAITSALASVPPRADTAMTGEVTLTGRVLPVGGLKEKLLAARRASLKRVIIPRKNLPDLEEIPRYVLKGLEIVPVSSMDEVLKEAFPARALSLPGRRPGRKTGTKKERPR